ncbi:MAG: RDD family protein [Actinomycetota bacterium]
MKRKVIFAGLGLRFAALLIDLLVFSALFFPVTRLLKGVWIMGAADHRWAKGLFITDPLCIAFLVFMAAYFVLLEAYWSKTLGKLAMGIKVAGTNGQKPGLKKSMARNILRVVDSLPAGNILGIILIASSRQKERFGDRIAGTRVIKYR